MEIYVLNKNLEILDVLAVYESLLWDIKLHEPGTFRAQFLFTESMNRVMQRGNLLYKTDEVEPGIITRKYLKLDKYGEQTIVIQGYMASRYLYQRIVWSKMILTGTIEEAMRRMVYEQAISPSDASRKIPRLDLGELKGYTGQIEKQVTYDNLQEALTGIAKEAQLGYRLRLDIEQKIFLFEVIQGTNRTIGTDQPCIFSREFGNVYTQEYTEDESNYKNICLVGGPGEDVERVLAPVGEASGLERYEMFYSANLLSEDGITRDELIKQMEQKGKEKLAQYYVTKAFETKIKEDYAMPFELGDFITCTDSEWGITETTQVKEIQKGYSKTEKSYLVTFGDDAPTLIDLIKAKE